MIIKLRWSPHAYDSKPVAEFLQRALNRLLMGLLRYGPPDRRKQYMGRMRKELEKYEETGNQENLINIVNYAFLEYFKPEHPQAHFNAYVGSATRHRFGGGEAGERREGD